MKVWRSSSLAGVSWFTAPAIMIGAAGVGGYMFRAVLKQLRRNLICLMYERVCKMHILIDFLKVLSFYPDYFILFMLGSGFYFFTIGPVLFKFIVIPNIERRYGVRMKVDEENIIMPFSNWMLPAMEVPYYVFRKCIIKGSWVNREIPTFTLLHKLVKINYDINRASKVEKIIIYMSFVFLVGLIVSCICVLIAEKYGL